MTNLVIERIRKKRLVISETVRAKTTHKSVVERKIEQ